MEVLKYKKRPVVIEACQITEDSADEIIEFVGNQCEVNIERTSYGEQVKVVIHTLEGDMTAVLGDYIIKGVKGEFYPCRKDIFEETYELA